MSIPVIAPKQIYWAVSNKQRLSVRCWTKDNSYNWSCCLTR